MTRASEWFVVGVAFVCFAIMQSNGWWAVVGGLAAAVLLAMRDQLRDKRLRG